MVDVMPRAMFYNTLSIAFNTLLSLYLDEEESRRRRQRTSCDLLVRYTSSSKELATIIKRSQTVEK
jgi:hypothetical protein